MLDLNEYISVIPDYPKPGISFKDVTSLISDADAFAEAVKRLSDFAKSVGATKVVGPEARGFIFASAVAVEAHLGFIPVRKPNKLPREAITYTYELEYGTDTLCMHKDAIKPGDKVVIVDDLIAIGGTALASAAMIEQLGGEVVGVGAVIALEGLPGREKIAAKYNFHALLTLSDKE